LILSGFFGNLKDTITERYAKYLYTREDYLFRVIFDKTYRPELYK